MRDATKILLGLTLAFSAVAVGCELIANVDHDKIKGAGGSGTGTASSASSTGTVNACMSGAMSCSAPGDCPAPASDCLAATCDGQGCCASAPKAAGAACSSTGGKVCDGAGHCVGCVQPADCPAQMTACKTDTCSADSCGTMNAPASTTCNDNGGKLCDGSGTCVACLAPTDCPAPTTVCKTNACNGNACSTTPAPKGTACTDSGGVVCDGAGACVAMHCMDNVKDADESDVDCGGASCAKCADAKTCNVAGDCADGVCSGTPKTCQAPTCTDGVKNGTETDVDCGGSCPKCADTKHCAANADCANNLCFGTGPGTCVSCMDGVKDGNETDKDCGGLQCDALGKLCAPGQTCALAGDCVSGLCQGTTCALRPNGNACTADSQCAAGHCVGPAGAQVCCNTACTGTCQACVMSLTGQADGTCSNMTAGLAAPSGQCTAAPPCGNTGKCAAGGACELTASGTPTPTQTAGDCQKIVCNGSGATQSINDPTDLPPASGTVCKINPACSGAPLAPSYTNAPTGSDCTADNTPPRHFCGDTSTALAGKCVQCNSNNDCNALVDGGVGLCNLTTGLCQ